MLSATSFKIGDWFTCTYHDKSRTCEVLDIPQSDYIVVRTGDGIRSFKYAKICNQQAVK